MLVWDATCLDTFALSHLQFTARDARAVANKAEWRKRVKYTKLATSHHFIPGAIETTGFFGPQAHRFFQELIGEPQSYHYILQLIVVAVQIGNTYSYHDAWAPSFPKPPIPTLTISSIHVHRCAHHCDCSRI